jgi:hypothetical protein
MLSGTGNGRDFVWEGCGNPSGEKQRLWAPRSAEFTGFGRALAVGSSSVYQSFCTGGRVLTCFSAFVTLDQCEESHPELSLNGSGGGK